MYFTLPLKEQGRKEMKAGIAYLGDIFFGSLSQGSSVQNQPEAWENLRNRVRIKGDKYRGMRSFLYG
jgi:hypothetical protein